MNLLCACVCGVLCVRGSRGIRQHARTHKKSRDPECLRRAARSLCVSMTTMRVDWKTMPDDPPCELQTISSVDGREQLLRFAVRSTTAAFETADHGVFAVNLCGAAALPSRETVPLSTALSTACVALDDVQGPAYLLAHASTTP